MQAQYARVSCTKRLLAIIGITIMSLSLSSYAQSSHPFVDPEFEVPATLETDRFRLRMLTVNDVVKDFDAVTTSKEHLQDIWGPGWPEGLTLEQNLIDLGWHQKEFQRRRSFAYTVVALDESRVVGCVYINPTRKTGYDAVVYLWARQSELASGMETELTEAVKAWLAAKWPFKNPALPGTNISMNEWENLKEQKR
jgi:RimJ/RimL family protein N-acetyltransferase